MMQGVRYRERGPMKSWRPETMAEAIWAVLQEGTVQSRFSDIKFSDNLGFSDYFSKTIFQFTT